MPCVLIVEDDPTILHNLGLLLELSGLDVIKAQNGQEAISLLSECEAGTAVTGRPGMIVSDLMMPNMDGFELLRTVRADDRLKLLPFVLLSARSDPSDLHKAFSLGASDYLVKPFDVEQLIEVIRYHLSIGGGSNSCSDNRPTQEGEQFFLE